MTVNPVFTPDKFTEQTFCHSAYYCKTYQTATATSLGLDPHHLPERFEIDDKNRNISMYSPFSKLDDIYKNGVLVGRTYVAGLATRFAMILAE